MKFGHSARLRQRLLGLLEDLDGVQQDPYWHPEGDALFHSLQVFGQAHRDKANATLLAAALLHDVGKGLPGDHATVGAALLRGWVTHEVVWLVEHHLDLLRAPRRTRRRLRGSSRLGALERLRRYDIAGRDPEAFVVGLQEAVDVVVEALHSEA